MSKTIPLFIKCRVVRWIQVGSNGHTMKIDDDYIFINPNKIIWLSFKYQIIESKKYKLFTLILDGESLVVISEELEAIYV